MTCTRSALRAFNGKFLIGYEALQLPLLADGEMILPVDEFETEITPWSKGLGLFRACWVMVAC